MKVLENERVEEQRIRIWEFSSRLEVSDLITLSEEKERGDRAKIFKFQSDINQVNYMEKTLNQM